MEWTTEARHQRRKAKAKEREHCREWQAAQTQSIVELMVSGQSGGCKTAETNKESKSDRPKNKTKRKEFAKNYAHLIKRNKSVIGVSFRSDGGAIIFRFVFYQFYASNSNPVQLHLILFHMPESPDSAFRFAKISFHFILLLFRHNLLLRRGIFISSTIYHCEMILFVRLARSSQNDSYRFFDSRLVLVICPQEFRWRFALEYLVRSLKW